MLGTDGSSFFLLYVCVCVEICSSAHVYSDENDACYLILEYIFLVK